MIGVARARARAAALALRIVLDSCTAMSGLGDGEVGGGSFKPATIFAERVRRMATK